MNGDVVYQKFQELLSQKSISIDTIDNSGLIDLTYENVTYQVSLDNARRDYLASGNFDVLKGLIETITSAKNIVTFQKSEEFIYPHLISSDLVITDIPIDSITAQSNLVFVINRDGNQSFIMNQYYEEWTKTKEEIEQLAFDNLDRIIENVKIEEMDIHGKTLGYFDSEFSLKSVCLLSKRLKDKVQEQFGWPICAVFPVKDLCYFFSENDLEFFSGRLGSTVLKEFNDSPHPISTELIKISDDGINAIGEY